MRRLFAAFTQVHGAWFPVGCVILLAGAWLRFADLGLYDLWTDEAWVALSIDAPTLRDMLFPDWYAQSTPPLFLLIVRWITGVLGYSEATLRLLPAIAGVASVALIGRLTYLWSHSLPASWIAALLWAFHPLALLYAHELKQYSTDACVLLALLCITERHARGGGWRSWVLLLLATCLGIGLSHPAIFAVPMISLRLLLRADVLPQWRRWGETAFYTLGAGMLFVLQFFFIVRPEQTPWLFDYWDQIDQFLPLPFSPSAMIVAVRQLWQFALYGFGQAAAWHAVQQGVAVAGVVLTGIGWLHMFRRSPAASSAPVVLLATTVGASMVRLYPFGGMRPSFFLIPLVISIASIGLERVARSMGSAGPVVAFTVLALLIPPLNAHTANDKLSWMIAEMQPLLARLEQERQPSDLLRVHPTARFSYRYYTHTALRDLALIGQWEDMKPTVTFEALKEDLLHVCQERAPLTRVWVVVAGRGTLGGDILERVLRPRVTVVSVLREQGAAAYLLQCEHPHVPAG